MKPENIDSSIDYSYLGSSGLHLEPHSAFPRGGGPKDHKWFNMISKILVVSHRNCGGLLILAFAFAHKVAK